MVTERRILSVIAGLGIDPERVRLRTAPTLGELRVWLQCGTPAECERVLDALAGLVPIGVYVAVFGGDDDEA